MDDASPSPLAQLFAFGRNIFSSRSPQQKSCESKSRPHGEIAEDPGGKRARRRVDFDSTDADNEQTKIQPGATVQYIGTGKVPLVTWTFGKVVDPTGSPPVMYRTRAVDPLDPSFRTLVAAGEVKVMYRVPYRNTRTMIPKFTNCKISDLVIWDPENDYESASDEPEYESDADGEIFRHECKPDGGGSEDESDEQASASDDGDGDTDEDKDGSGAVMCQSTFEDSSDFEPHLSRAIALGQVAEKQKETDTEPHKSSTGSLDGEGDIQTVTEVEYVLGRVSSNKNFPILARADKAGVEKFVSRAIGVGVQYKVKWKGEQKLAVANANGSFALQIANFELGYKFRDAQIVKSENDRTRYRATGANVADGGTARGAVRGTKPTTSKRKR
jgi:hypothetical protein